MSISSMCGFQGGCSFAVITAGTQTGRAEARVLEHQVHFHDQQAGIEEHEAGDRSMQAADRQGRCGKMCRQDAEDGPRLAAVFGHEPAHLRSDPRQRNEPQRPAQQPALFVEGIFGRVPEGECEQQREGEAQRYHDAEGPEHRRYFGNRIPCRLRDHFRCRLGDVGGVFFQQQTEAQVGLVRFEVGLGRIVGRLGAQLFERLDGDDAALDAFVGARFELVDAGNHLGRRARGDEAEGIGNFDLGRVLTLLVIGNCEQREGCRGGFGLPHAFQCGEFGLLVFGHRIAGFIAQHDHRQRRGEAEGGGDAEGALGELDIAALEQVPGADAEHEHGAGDVTGRYGVHELGLGRRVEHHVPERGHLHAHGDVAEFGAHGVLHPAVGDKNPNCRQVGADGSQERDQQMPALGKFVPAEKEQADESGFEEERHQSFNGQRRAENVADVVRVIRPVGAELEFHGQAGGDAQRKVDAEQLAPEFGHVAVDFLAGHDEYRLHDDQQKRQPQCQGDEQEMVEGRGGKLQPRQVNDFLGNHLWCSS